MLLTKKKRQEYLKYLGIKDIKSLQKKYFTRKEDIDGVYGKNTDILLRNAYNVKKYCENFKLEEFKCQCKGCCTHYPVLLDINLLKYIQEIRNKYGVVRITSAVRCKKHNKEVGGVSKSKHLEGKAIDLTNSKICKNDTSKKAFMNEYIKKPKAHYTYTNGYARTKKQVLHPVWKSMNGVIHIDTK